MAAITSSFSQSVWASLSLPHCVWGLSRTLLTTHSLIWWSVLQQLDLAGAKDQNIHREALHVPWASCQYGVWVPRKVF